MATATVYLNAHGRPIAWSEEHGSWVELHPDSDDVSPLDKFDDEWVPLFPAEPEITADELAAAISTVRQRMRRPREYTPRREAEWLLSQYRITPRVQAWDRR
ncbi:hypothetical protein HUW46_09219 [Amycolatopsis sp. CA-230715]|nr:hypothetical protein HUW46_09219 [Amycolatopsis sp. CA-230715]